MLVVKSSPVGFLNEQFYKTIDPKNKNSVLGSDAQAVIGNIPTVKNIYKAYIVPCCDML